MVIPPEPPERYWTRESIARLAARFDLPDDEHMQDWAYEVSDPDRIGEFFGALNDYRSEPDLQVTLMDIILQSLEESNIDLAHSSIWQSLSEHLEGRFDLHAHQVWYWAAFDSDPDEAWRISPWLRDVWYRRNPGTE